MSILTEKCDHIATPKVSIKGREKKQNYDFYQIVTVRFKNSSVVLRLTAGKQWVTIWFEPIRADCHKIIAEMGL